MTKDTYTQRVTDPKSVENALNKVVDAWEALPGGRFYNSREVGVWVNQTLYPAIQNARNVLGRKSPHD